MEYVIIVAVIVGVATGILIGRKMSSKSFSAEELAILRKEVKEKEKEIIELSKDAAVSEQKAIDLENMKEKLKLEFENVANRILKSSCDDFSNASEAKLNHILTTLKNDINHFEKALHDAHKDGIKASASLKTQIASLMNYSKQLSDDANNLTKALKGEVKTQGNWGELLLERLLEKVGLRKGDHFKMQESFKDEEGKTKYPDCVIYLPEKRCLIIDSKVSLNAYERFLNAVDDKKRKEAADGHLKSIENHIKELNGKKYEKLGSISAPDYVFMFVPIEGAVALALNEEPALFEDAMARNIVIVSASTLLATLMTVAYIWKQEDQKRNVKEIARLGGRLYDKFVGFVENMERIGQKIMEAKDSHDSAMIKLSTGRGNLVVSAEKLKELGANTKKSLTKVVVDNAQ